MRPAAERDLSAQLTLYSELNPDDAPLPQAPTFYEACGVKALAQGFRRSLR
ncbi:hypothetical protein [Streptomyces sp. NPDC020742]|uniref:hypothetical protein n=1 Tax=Streptomyces sp. NPDC020742 TaxID=3154897 RepID=UPI0033F21F52